MNCSISRCICKTSYIICFLPTPYKKAHKSTEVVSNVLYLNVFICICFILCKTNAPYLPDNVDMLKCWLTCPNMVMIQKMPWHYIQIQSEADRHWAGYQIWAAVHIMETFLCSWVSVYVARGKLRDIFCLQSCLSVFVCVYGCINSVKQNRQQNQSNWRLDI